MDTVLERGEEMASVVLAKELGRALLINAELLGACRAVAAFCESNSYLANHDIELVRRLNNAIRFAERS